MFKVDTSLERREVLEDSISLNLIKFHNLISIGLNIVIPFVLLLFFKVDLATYLLCFLIFDILQTIFEEVILRIHQGFGNLTWLLQKRGYQKKVSEMSLDEINLLKKNLDNSSAFSKEKLEVINEKIKEFKSLESVATPMSRKNEIVYVEEMILKFNEFEGSKWIKKYMTKIVETSDRLIALIKNDEDSIVEVINTYNIYSEELLKIVSSYENMDDTQKEKYKDKIETLLNDFCNHLLDLENRIISFKEHSIDFDIDFLQKKLKEEKEKHV